MVEMKEKGSFSFKETVLVDSHNHRRFFGNIHVNSLK
ncbi:MAG: hypothetical protein K0Q47_1615 [Sedimentibacter sp.]|nr:hypothetical protein [Sedimentibacter sp.]